MSRDRRDRIINLGVPLCAFAVTWLVLYVCQVNGARIRDWWLVDILVPFMWLLVGAIGVVIVTMFEETRRGRKQ